MYSWSQFYQNYHQNGFGRNIVWMPKQALEVWAYGSFMEENSLNELFLPGTV